MSAAIITDPKAAMAILCVLYTEHEAICDQIEDLTDRGTKSQQRTGNLKGLIAEAHRINELEFVAATLVLALDPTFGDICGVYDAADEIIDAAKSATTKGGAK
jgi:hypothetical protein